MSATNVSKQRWLDMDKVEKYREKADHARRLAKAISDAVAREQLEIAAKEYDEMADQLSADDGTAQDKS